MTQLELLAAKVRGADSNAEGGEIIADWYDAKVKHSRQNSKDSAEIIRKGITTDYSPAYITLFTQLASNFDCSASLLEFDRQD